MAVAVAAGSVAETDPHVLLAGEKDDDVRRWEKGFTNTDTTRLVDWDGYFTRIGPAAAVE